MSFNIFILDQLCHLLLPTSCVLCTQLTPTSHALCAGCASDLPILSHHCRQCAYVLPLPNTICGKCLTNPPPFSRAHALFIYEAPIVRFISMMKFQRQLSHARVLAHLIVHKINSSWYHHQCLPDVLLPVPLHQDRLRERGFNQALELAKPIAKACKMRLDVHGVARIKATPAQSGLSAKERRMNLLDAFQVLGDYQGKTVAIIDDVMTTGQTLSMLAGVLKKAGAIDVHVWCIARTMLPGSS